MRLPVIVLRGSRGGVSATWLAGPATAQQHFAAAYYVLRPQARALVERRGVGQDEALAALLHGIWRTIAPRLGPRYDRVRAVR